MDQDDGMIIEADTHSSSDNKVDEEFPDVSINFPSSHMPRRAFKTYETLVNND